MEKEKRILTYFFSWLLMGILVCFIGITNVFAETYTPDGAKSQIRTLLTDNTQHWFTSEIGDFGTPLYFGTGPTFSTYGIPCNMRLIVITDVSTDYSYKFGYNMTIYTPYSSTNTWDSTKLDTNYDLKVADDNGVVKDSKCTVVNTETTRGNTGIYTTKHISCVVSIKKDYTDAWLSTGYYCRGDCNLSNMESLGYIPQDSYMTITSPTYERFEDNSNVIIDQNQTIIDQNNKTNEELGNIKDNINESTEDLKESIEENNKETQEVIKDQFNSCSQFDKNITNFTYGSISGSNGENTSDNSTTRLRTDFFEVDSSKQYTVSFLDDMVYQFYIFEYNSNKSFIKRVPPSSWGTNGFIFTTSSNTKYLRFVIRNSNDVVFDNLDIGTLNIKGEKICTNKLDEAEDTRKGIWATIKDLPNMFLDMLLGLFIPDDNYFNEWFEDLKQFFESKLGFLYTSIEIIIEFIQRYTNLSDSTDIVINIPNISVPNFEDYIIIEETTFNWGELLESKESINTLWNLYLAFIDVFLILNFINLCENKYNRIFGGDTTPYEYYTTEDSYMYDTNTGSISQMGVHKEKRTTRKKVN